MRRGRLVGPELDVGEPVASPPDSLLHTLDDCVIPARRKGQVLACCAAAYRRRSIARTIAAAMSAGL